MVNGFRFQEPFTIIIRYDFYSLAASALFVMSSTPRKKPSELRSQQWFGRQDRDGFAYRSWVKGKGVPHDQFDGRPVIGICNTFSELTPCNSHFRTLAEQVKIGVYEAGGFPLEFPVMSLGETLLRPTAMLYRNMARMDVEDGIARSPGHCMTMGTASTMTSAAEVLGLTLPGAASIPAPDSRHAQMATLTGKHIVDLVWHDVNPLDFLTPASFDNAVTAVLALGGSTNSIVHLIAMAKRAGFNLTLDRFDALARQTPVLANLRPSGAYLMEDFYYAGGLRALLTRITDLLDMTQRNALGQTLAQALEGAQVHQDDVIRSRDNPLVANDGLAVLRGNLAPDGAVIKPAAMEAHLRQHTGRAVVFKDYNDMSARIDDPQLDIDASCVIVLQSAGPQGAPGMPEWGQLPIPQKLLKQGVRDMVRVSDARMSGTSYGACVLHVAPESHVGGPLALDQDGDPIRIDIEGRRIDVLISDEEMTRRRANWQAPAPKFQRGYGTLYLKHIQQADKGCDFDFLLPEGAAPDGEPEIH